MFRTRLKRVTICIASIALLLAGCTVPAAAPPVEPSLTPAPKAGPFVPTPAGAGTAEPTSAASKLLVVFDDDGSRDGTAALLYLLSHPEVSIGSVSISYGEAHPAVYVQHTGRVLDSFGINLPLGAGQDAPLAAATPFPDWLRQLSDNFWNYPVPNMDRTYAAQSAPDLMVSVINAAPGPVTLFVSGPFTSLAQALRSDPAIRNKISAVYFMGGAVHVPGNIRNLLPDSTNTVAEWNIFADPQAAKEVFDSGLNLYMVPLDATNPVTFTQAELLPWHQGGAKASLVADLYDLLLKSPGINKAEIFDLTAAALMLKPELCAFQSLPLDVITANGDTLGQTALVANGKPNVNVCLAPDVNLVKKELNDTFAGSAPPAAVPPIDPVVGTWTGSVFNGGFEMQMSITIEATCQLGQVCGRFDISTVGCSGNFTWVGMDGEMYEFQAGDKTKACGEGKDYLLPQKDGSVVYISRGAYGETNGALQKAP